MTHYTVAEYDQLCRNIASWIGKNGYVPTVRELADHFNCSPATAWRIVRAQGWEAKGHRWEHEKKRTRKGP